MTTMDWIGFGLGAAGCVLALAGFRWWRRNAPTVEDETDWW